MPRTSILLLSKQVQIQKELFRAIISDLETRPQKAQKALEKIHPDLFKL